MSNSDDESSEQVINDIPSDSDTDDEKDIELNNLQWNKNFIPVIDRYSVLKKESKLDEININNCLEYFNLMFPKKFYEIIIKETNIYAKQKIQRVKIKTKSGLILHSMNLKHILDVGY